MIDNDVAKNRPLRTPGGLGQRTENLGTSMTERQKRLVKKVPVMLGS